jgi:hypothetical protein
MTLIPLHIFYCSFAAKLFMIKYGLQVKPSIAVIDGAFAYVFREWQLISIGGGAAGWGMKSILSTCWKETPLNFFALAFCEFPLL